MSDIQEEQKRQYKRAEENDIKLLQEENKQLKILCDKYEEEHNNEFQCWKRDRKELLDKRNRINEAVEYINKMWEKNSYYNDIDNCLQFCNFNEFQKEDILNILQGKEE